MKDYFGVHIKFVLNVTDIDDKIILRAGQKHLLARFKEKQGGEIDSPVPRRVIETTLAAFKWYIQQTLPRLAPGTTPEIFVPNVYKAS
jgi:cysteinyl-tRNA synthetase